MSAILRSFATTAARTSFIFGVNHVGRLVTDQQTGKTYIVIGEGLGSAVTVLLDPAGTPAGHHTSHESGGSDAIQLDNLAAPDDNTDLNASTSKHGLLRKLSGSASDVLAGDGSWVAFGSTGGASSYPIYLADLTPGSPHADDDEFDDNSISGSWSTWDVAGYVTVTEGAEGLKFAATGNATNRWAGKYKAVPASEFAAIAKFVLAPPDLGASGTALGLFVSDNLGTVPSTADFRQIEAISALSATSHGIISRTWNAYNGATSASTATTPTDQIMYVRIRLNGTAMKTDYSWDGYRWKYHSSVTLGFTPVHYGISFLQNDAVAGEAYCRFFRVASGAGSSAFTAHTTGALKHLLYQ